MKYDYPVKSIELKKDGKIWVEVTFENGVKWQPRLWEVGAILSGIGKAEDIKYPDGAGYKYTKKFIDKCWGKKREEVYNMSLSREFDPNGIMNKRYGKKQCKTCKRWFEGNTEICNNCDGAEKGWDSYIVGSQHK